MYDHTDQLRTEPMIPANVEAEQAVLGSILIDPDAVVEVAELLTADDFHLQKHGWIYQAILDLNGKNSKADFLTVTDELERRRQLDEAGGPAYVMDLLNAVPTAIHATHYARIVEERAVARRLLRAAGQIAQSVYEVKSIDRLCASAVELVETAVQRKGERRAKTLTAVLNDTVAQAREHARLRAEGHEVSIPFGIPELDRRTGGMWPTDVIVLAAPPGGGKTALALGIAHQAAKTGATGAVFSLEMQDTQVGERILAPESGYTAIQIRLGDIQDWQVLDAARARASTDNLLVDDSASLTMADLTVRVKRLHLRHAIQFVVVDYVQLLTAGLRTENRTQELAYISRQLKALAKELHIAVIVVAQLNRDYDKRADKRPRMSDLEGSSQWEKDASVIVFIHRESQFVPEADVNRATLILAKARNGQIGDFPVGWNPRYSQFTPEPLVFGEADRRAHRLELLRQCEALSYSWADWHLHPLGLEQVLQQGRAQVKQLEGDPKRLVTQVGQALASSQRLDEAVLRELSALARSRNGATPPVVTDFLAVGARAAVLQQAREQVAPALLEGRFAIFFGPSGRGKTLLARIVQRALILEHGMPAVWMNWRQTMREIKGTFNGNGREAEVWQQTHAPVLILDDPDKGTTEWSVGYLYDLLDQRMALTGGKQGPVLLVLNQLPKEFGEQLARHGHLGVATAQRGLQRGRPVLVDFSALPVWEERPGF